MSTTLTFGPALKAWRQRRRLSQMDLALDAGVSTRHLSFLETGRAIPSRDMVLRLAEHLALPLREQNLLLAAAGYAPAFPERPLDDPAMQPVRAAVDQVLAGHDPFPALAIDRHWHLVSANRAAHRLMTGLPAHLLQPPVNVLRLSLDPAGLAPRIVNLPEWRAHILARLRHQAETSADPAIAALLAELQSLPSPTGLPYRNTPAPNLPVLTLQLATDGGILSFITTTMVFGTPLDVTLAELAIESFFPADAATARALQASN